MLKNSLQRLAKQLIAYCVCLGLFVSLILKTRKYSSTYNVNATLFPLLAEV